MSEIVDAAQRQRAIDPTASFCVSAPAGSGKTEILIQRFLGLLARVVRPEQVLAITFTRKAAAEMRDRVVTALQSAALESKCTTDHEQVTRNLARAVLAVDEREGWALLHNVTRLNIQTIDGFCRGLTLQMPVLSAIGGQANPQDDAQLLYREAISDLFALMEDEHPIAADLRAVLAHLDNNWQRLQGMLETMLQRRQQWQDYVRVHTSPRASEQYLIQLVQQLVEEELQALHAVLAHYEPDIVDLQKFAAGNKGESALEAFPGTSANDLAGWRLVRNLLLTKENVWRKRITVAEGFPKDQSDHADRQKKRMRALLDELSSMSELQAQLGAVASLPELTEGSTSWSLVVHLSRLLPVLAAQLLLVFRRYGQVDYTQITQSALDALGEEEAPTDLALRLDYAIEHILVDEFQDTAIAQYKLLHKLTRGWGEYNAANPDAPRTLMIVGDAMQSIYGFRDANVGLFINAQRDSFNGVTLEPLVLASNFRSDAALVDWVNHCFQPAFPSTDDMVKAQVRYHPAAAVRPTGDESPVTLDVFCGEEKYTDEALYICAQIQQHVAAGETDIAVLGRQRKHVQTISRRLKSLGVPHLAQELNSLAHSPAVADLLTLCRALANRADRLAWLALLRAPWCGVQLADLLCIGRWQRERPLAVSIGDPQLLAQLSPAGQCRLLHVHSVLQHAEAQRDRLALRVWVEQAWLALGGPQALDDPLGLDDAEQFFQLLEQADAAAIGLDTGWLSRQLEKQFMSGGDAHSPVQLLTIHKAKGLEFTRVYIPRLDGQTGSDRNTLLLADEHITSTGQRGFLLAANDDSEKGEPSLFNYMKVRRKNKEALETTRLLYVGATRAIKHLHLSASLNWDAKKECIQTPSSSSLLRTIWCDEIAAQATVHGLTESAAGSSRDVDQMSAPLSRLVESSLPQFAYEPGKPTEPSAGLNRPDHTDNYFERSVGTVVHWALEMLAMGENLPQAISTEHRQLWQQQLQSLGLWGESCRQGLAVVEQSIAAMLSESGCGPWVLSAAHEEARNEWTLAVATADGAARDIVIDRSFIDVESGHRWIVDYKTSVPRADETLESFTARECDHYREQLRAYRDALCELVTEPLRCALCFTALGHLQVLPELDAPGR